MNRHLPGRRCALTRVACLLATLLAIAWAVSFVCFVKLHHLDAAANTLVGGGLGGASSEAGAAHHENQIGDQSSKEVHIVFSTDCSGYQHWQSIASWYSLRRAGHLGRVTRIASGCTPAQEDAIRLEFEKIRRRPANERLGVHFTPSFALGGKNYKYSNKPGGMLHWIRNNTNLEEPVVALVDPDMMALRPVLPTLGEGLTAVPAESDGYRDLEEYVDAHGRPLLLRRNNLPKLPPRVTRGMAAGQNFGLGAVWANAGTPKAGKDFRQFNLTEVCGAGSPCLNVPPKSRNGAYTTKEYADKHFAVGPVYLATTPDWAELLPRWHDFTPRVHAQYPKLLAEMFGFTMSAADMQLPFALSSSYMVSDPKTFSSTESWMWADEYARDGEEHSGRSVCKGATHNSLPTETLRRLRAYGYGSYARDDDNTPAKEAVGSGGLPTFLHYCQNYQLSGHKFAKRKVPHDFFRCDGEPLKFDVDALAKELESSADRKLLRTGFMLCHLIPLMNMALEDYKSDVC
ncbi:hypothetical protein ACHAXT_012141 [Thalassiosira profunda]